MTDRGEKKSAGEDAKEDKRSESGGSDRPERASEESDDFYFENGFLVFTEKYHLKRGYCCGSGCRHCPYHSGR